MIDYEVLMEEFRIGLQDARAEQLDSQFHIQVYEILDIGRGIKLLLLLNLDQEKDIIKGLQVFGKHEIQRVN